MLQELPFTIPSLQKAYASGVTAADVIAEVYRRLAASEHLNAFICVYPVEDVIERVNKLGSYDPSKPLWGIPFAVKDNIDALGLQTTAGCPDFAYLPERDARVVENLRQSGALLIGKTNLDQFATGLVGTRSPWGACLNAFDPDFVSGGSSSGSAVAVALNTVSFSLGTDTAGSGRVPAAFNNIIGLKPSLGRLSSRGVVPACKTLDCVSIFALTAEDAISILELAGAYDEDDPWSREYPPAESIPDRSFTFGVPDDTQLQFFGNSGYAQAFQKAIAYFQSIGGKIIQFDYQPFAETASLLYEGPWVAERKHAVQSLLKEDSKTVLPVIRTMLGLADNYSALDAFEAQYQLQALRHQVVDLWDRIDFMLLPTAPSHPTIASVDAEPILRNQELGTYTNFVNLMDLSAIAAPAGFDTEAGMPFGVSLIGLQGREKSLAHFASKIQAGLASTLGATKYPIPIERGVDDTKATKSILTVPLAVCGAHLSGQPLNHQLTDRGGILVSATSTAPKYRFYALRSDTASRPGLIRHDDGAPIQVEVWELPAHEVGAFIDAIEAPLGVGRVELVDGSNVMGFLCEEYATRDAIDITEYGGWRSYIETLAPSASENAMRDTVD
tara:strand:- start:730 stop:2571 length:1842 start_codon:yes stop_codon:yes gene_type:complete